MNNPIQITTIKNKIYIIREKQVMLDRDLAQFYGVKPIRLREQVKRNIKRFPSDFMFQLTEDEVDFMVSQNAIPSKKHLGGSLPLVFTEQGVANISSILTSDRAIEVNIQIMRAFVAMRHFISENKDILQRLTKTETKLLEHENNFNQIFTLLENSKPKPDKGIFFEGQLFDAHIFISDLIREAKKEISLIDNFIDERTLLLFTKRNKRVKTTIYTKTISKQLKQDLNKFNSQYEPIKIKQFNLSHDRFFIIDNQLYHIGASLKDIGKKWFGFSKMNKESISLLEKLEYH